MLIPAPLYLFLFSPPASRTAFGGGTTLSAGTLSVTVVAPCPRRYRSQAFLSPVAHPSLDLLRLAKPRRTSRRRRHPAAQHSPAPAPARAATWERIGLSSVLIYLV